jgi:predicted transposase/invertase (TIGR01784 family)
MTSPYNLTTDFLFRAVFGKQKNSTILRSLISAVLEAKGYPPITVIMVANPEIEGDALKEKSGILDVLAVDSNGRNYNNEIQVRRQRIRKTYRKRKNNGRGASTRKMGPR